MSKKIMVLGSGATGTTVAKVLEEQGLKESDVIVCTQEDLHKYRDEIETQALIGGVIEEVKRRHELQAHEELCELSETKPPRYNRNQKRKNQPLHEFSQRMRKLRYRP